MAGGLAGVEQFFYQSGFAGTRLTDKSDVADLIDRHRASLQMTCETEHVFVDINDSKANLISGHELHWSRAGLPPFRLPCHFSDDSIHTTTTLLK
ncbi:hypothetical protein DA096_05690 [Vibrio rotiferianus]|nr:hypothetical protein BSZ04_05925 [Vibrio rotiferianus]TMX40691.1 hypothetical protein DA095_08280 [Vibrio rotiferianus]TMX57494.1 hypothetical protein DA093_05980 [Vibrio rotiferianus]TMX68053.1 hypothetical protein DA096_05690 [Vibrio rotiferianus]TMX73605.1 hypothetical protein DA097_00295 [Vibrio rotiferianus]